MSQILSKDPSESAPPSERQIRLRVGEREFVTSKETLQESGFFSSLLNRWEHNALPDGSYFIDGDGSLFEHVLCYLRRGVLPVFYTKEKGHDYAMYSAILQEARYYQIERLRKWIEEKKYLEVFQMEVITTSHEKTFFKSPLNTRVVVVKDKVGAEAEIEQSYHWTKTKEFVCPQWGANSQVCGPSCMTSTGSRKHKENEKDYFHQLQVIQVRKEIVYNHELCVEWGYDGPKDEEPVIYSLSH